MSVSGRSGRGLIGEKRTSYKFQVLKTDISVQSSLKQRWESFLNPAGSELPFKPISEVRAILRVNGKSVSKIHKRTDMYKHRVNMKIIKMP